jgi:hypothetical protein
MDIRAQRERALKLSKIRFCICGESAGLRTLRLADTLMLGEKSSVPQRIELREHPHKKQTIRFERREVPDPRSTQTESNQYQGP